MGRLTPLDHTTGAAGPIHDTPTPAEGPMTALATPVPTDVEHRWELRLEEFEDGHTFRRFECVECGAVRYE